MSTILSDRSRQMLSQSLPLVEAHKHEVIDRMQAVLALAEPDRNPGQSEINAMMLVEMLVNHVRHVLKTGKFDDLAHIPGEHEELQITGRTYSRFGDFLVPILKDVLGRNTPDTVPGLWCDAFWRIIRKATSAQPVLEAA
jgi:hemoglobin-like flavoprotein